MRKRRNSQVARKAAQLVVLIDTLPDPIEERDRVALEKARKLAYAIDREMVRSEESGKQVDARWFGWVAELAKIIRDWVL